MGTPGLSRQANQACPFLFSSKPWIMGVVNVTPDSFYPGGRAPTVGAAQFQLQKAVEGGAAVLDIGGESTRPGAPEISADDEARRVLPALEAARDRWPHIPVSVDTQKAAVARQALERGAAMINDISALRHDPNMAAVVADAGVPVVLMHMQGTPATMQDAPRYADVVGEVLSFFEERLRAAEAAGIAADNIVLDPGIGFGKTAEHNVTLLRNLRRLTSLGRPLLIGVSRKSFLGRLSAPAETPLPPEERLEASVAAALWAVSQGASGLRVHDVEATRRALATWTALEGRS